MFDFNNIPLEFWTSLEFFCIILGVFPVILSFILALVLIAFDILKDSKWYKDRRLRTVEVQTDQDLELMDFYESGASPLDLIPDDSSSGSTTPPYPSSSTNGPSASGPSTSDPSNSDPSTSGPSTSGKSTSSLSSPPAPEKPDSSSSCSPKSNGSTTKLSSSTTPAAHSSALPEFSVAHQASSEVSSAFNSFDEWDSPPPPPKIKSILLKTVSSENLSQGKSSFQKSPLRMTLSSNMNWSNTLPDSFSTNPFGSYVNTRDNSDNVDLLDFNSPYSYYRNPLLLRNDRFPSSENIMQEYINGPESALGDRGGNNTIINQGKNGMVLSAFAVGKAYFNKPQDSTDLVSYSKPHKLGMVSSSPISNSASRDQYYSEVYMGVI